MINKSLENSYLLVLKINRWTTQIPAVFLAGRIQTLQDSDKNTEEIIYCIALCASKNKINCFYTEQKNNSDPKIFNLRAEFLIFQLYNHVFSHYGLN